MDTRKLHTDDTPVPVQAPGTRKTKTGRIWAYVRDDRNAGSADAPAVCLGKKNYLFFGNDHGGERGALLYGLLGTCRLNGIDPEAYLRYILSVLPEWPVNKVAELLPWNVVLPD